MSDCGCNRYITRDEFDSRMDEAMRWIERFIRPNEGITREEFERRMNRVDTTLAGIDGHVLAIEQNLTLLGEKMAANFDQLDADLNTLAQGYVALQAANKQLSDALASADADKAAAVAQAIADDDAVDQAAVDAADAIAQGVLNPPAPPA